MREIKFRQWKALEEKMTRPFDLLDFAGDQDSEYGNFDFSPELTEKDIAPFQRTDGVTPSPLMQFTGLLDKNGKEIYEGDIIKIRDIAVEVYWDEGTAAFRLTFPESPGRLYLGHYDKNLVEIIGNIYENPELLK